MKNFYWILSIIVSCGVLWSCSKEDENPRADTLRIELDEDDASIRIVPNPDITYTPANPDDKFFNGTDNAVRKDLSPVETKLKSLKDGETDALPPGNTYRFSLIGEYGTLTLSFPAPDNVLVQATHVKIAKSGNDYYAFVAYNEKGDGHHGAIGVFKVTDIDGDNHATVTLQYSIEMKNAEVSAIDYYNNKLLFTGAAHEPKFGYNETDDGYNYAFCGSITLDAAKNPDENTTIAVRKLTSFQGTSVKAYGNKLYVTTGDGTKETQGGLYILNAADLTEVYSSPQLDHARSVDIDSEGVYVYQAEPARITKFPLEGGSGTQIYAQQEESTQKDAKSEILAWKNYLLVAENESGLRMITKTGDVHDFLSRPGEDAERHVTNSIALNTDPKLKANGTSVNSNLLLLANGERGVYWYDIASGKTAKNVEFTDRMLPGAGGNAILGFVGLSANFIASEGNLAFLADGLGGLKVLHIGFDPDVPPVIGEACDDIMPLLLNDPASLFPPGESVFSGSQNNNEIVKTLFASENVDSIPEFIAILEDTELHISFHDEGAAWQSAFGFFVVPAGETRPIVQYYNEEVKQLGKLYTGTKSEHGQTVYVLNQDYTIFKQISKVGDIDPPTDGPLIPNAVYKVNNYLTTDGNFKKGDKIIFFLVPNGYRSNPGEVHIVFDNSLDSYGYYQLLFCNKALNQATNVYFDPNAYPKAFYDAKANYNMFYNVSCGNFMILIEDIAGSSNGGELYEPDTDFNDIIFSIGDGTAGTVKLERPRFSVGFGDDNILKITD
ncbi:MAG: DUF4114 domain-containing protein [Bacteroidales bacterium]|nr:DUF4114 domain-containing protein [Bacteroidales bacterium]